MLYALADINNFYCEAERAFRPQLNGRPLVVLSSNDGNAISRSEEAKALGIKMGAPWQEIRHLVDSAGLVALSSNFTLYGELSDRVMTILAHYSPRVEVYSIDECFLDLQGLPGQPLDIGKRMRDQVLRWVGLPTCVGIANTKTLAKFANHVAKTAERKPGIYPPHFAQVCDLEHMSSEDREDLFARTAIGEVWGIGPRIEAQLVAGGIKSISDLLRVDIGTLRRQHSVVLERTVRELMGVSCIPFDDAPAPRQQIMCSRSFGKTVQDFNSLLQAISDFASRAAEKLRQQSSLAASAQVFIRTSPFRQHDAQYGRSATVPLPRPTADTRLLLQAAVAGLRAIFKPGYNYAKAGVMLMDLSSQDHSQGELDLEADPITDKSRLMSAVDAVNRRYGRGSLVLASMGPGGEHAWHAKRERLTPCYTTRWEDIPIARA